MRNNLVVAALLAAFAAPAAQASTSIDLSTYLLTGNYTLDRLGDDMGWEASAVAYARDRGTLFFVGDEGRGVVEITKTGEFVGSMAFNWSGTDSTNKDAEGLTYLGNGQLVVVDERPQVAYRFDYASGTTLSLNSQPKVAITGSTANVGNFGTEGISYDPFTQKFYSVKQDKNNTNPSAPEADGPKLRLSTLDFALGGGTASTENAVLRQQRRHPVRPRQPLRRADAAGRGCPDGLGCGRQPADPEPGIQAARGARSDDRHGAELLRPDIAD